ncbi:MAG: gamma-glutamyltransferase [Acidobacteria bacterium RIFCSPLOWO2_02_FULL_68_18]|nr:MAG: gamma-glutamyltransferase [Acidobacteria bacterium RIFCSPLOWO2_02_FULL_68_18]OFW51812.1 MAG: gamma-glutamyltransferase [Acidobacteria bacterium RIFCSPLOWO2_12_FULL_68_19]
MTHRAAPSGDRPTGRITGTRSPVCARSGMIATSQPLASAAGLQALQEGGNAIDAAVTAAAVLAVVEPTMTGVGGDLFAIVHDGRSGTLKGLNSSGRAGSRADPDALTARGLAAMPLHGPLTVTVPGSVAGWAGLLQEYGSIRLARALAPAIHYAREGFPVSEIVAAQWDAVAPRLATDAEASRVLLPGGRAPAAGTIFRNPDLAATLEQIASGGPEAVYGGPIGAAIAAHVAGRGGFLTVADLAAHRADWVEPVSTTYRGHRVHELPPNTQGFVALEMLNILEGYDVRSMGHNSADYLHVYAEAKRIAFADRAAHLADPARVPSALLQLLVSKEYAAERRKQIDGRRAAPRYEPAPPQPYVGRGPRSGPAVERRGDTVYLAAADRFGNVISLINSLFDSFGSGLVVPGTGIALHSRGAGFTLRAGHPNRLAPGKRPAHTLVPAFLAGEHTVMAFGVMGADNQAQAHAQIVANMVDFGMNVQETGEVARVRHLEEGLALESGVSEPVRAELRARGHAVHDGRGLMGGYQAVRLDRRTGVLEGGSDPRKDGLAIGW